MAVTREADVLFHKFHVKAWVFVDLFDKVRDFESLQLLSHPGRWLLIGQTWWQLQISQIMRIQVGEEYYGAYVLVFRAFRYLDMCRKVWSKTIRSNTRNRWINHRHKQGIEESIFGCFDQRLQSFVCFYVLVYRIVSPPHHP